MQTVHTSVLLQEAVDELRVKPGCKYIDATLGGAGHSQEIIRRGGLVLGIDEDRNAIERARTLQISNEKLSLAQGNFSKIKEIAMKNKFEKVSGVIFDLGLSSDQLENSGKGFSFLKNEMLDMRMGENGIKAEEIVNTWSEDELAQIFVKFAEEHDANAIAKRIIEKRKKKPIKSTLELVEAIDKTRVIGKIHPATKVFMALRIAVNDEFGVLKKAIRDSQQLLEDGGRTVVITFHSLEDRIVKREFISMQKEGIGKIVTKKPIFPTALEMKKNRRARSAKLRVFEKMNIEGKNEKN